MSLSARPTCQPGKSRGPATVPRGPCDIPRGPCVSAPKEGALASALRGRSVCAAGVDLPMLLPTGETDLFHLPDGGPVKHIRTLVNPTRPRPTLAQGDAAWRLLSPQNSMTILMH